MNESAIEVPGPGDRHWKVKLWNGHDFLSYNFNDGMYLVDSNGIPDDVYACEDELYSRELYVGNLIEADRLREIDLNKLLYFANLDDFDNDVNAVRLSAKINVHSGSVTLTPRR